MGRKILYNIVLALTLTCCLWSCKDETSHLGDGMDSGVLTLNMVTRATDTEQGEDAYNENKIERADVFFFNNENADCIYAVTGITPSPGNKLLVKLSNEIVENNKYYIYVVANKNLGYTQENIKNVKISDIKAKVITTDWKNGLEEGQSVTENSLVMDGEASVTVSKKQSSTINLTRAMAKIALFPTAEDKIEVGEGAKKLTYTPVYKGMNVTFVNGVKSTNLNNDYKVNSESDYIVRMKRSFSDSDNDGKFTQVPFYSYPNPEATVNRKDSYLILCLPWSLEGQGTQQALNYYYRIPIVGNDAPAVLLRNKYYKINVHVGVLGSLDPKDAVELQGDFVILDWNTMNIDADMQNYQYLVLDEYYSVMNNVNELKMPFISSSDIDWTKTKITKVTYPNYNDQSSPNTGYSSTVTLQGNQISSNGFKLESENNNLIFSHEVTNQDYVPYTITIDVYNTEGIKADTWTIVQYPAIYIVGDYNSKGASNRFVYKVASGGVDDDDSHNLGGVYDPTENATNKNLNQYTIYITSFDIGDDYVIGDPRNEDVDENVMSGLQEKTDNNRRNLTYYYSSRKDNVEKMVAPAFKIASSWGVVDGNGITYQSAQRRCASYQENGYPAGRWRVPTEAEIKYIVGLSIRKVIPALFNGDYYASSGRFYDNGYQGSEQGFFTDENKHSVRCVYDVWYWGNDKLLDTTKFTWGDEKRK